MFGKSPQTQLSLPVACFHANFTQAKLQKGGFVPGESIRLDVTLQNNSSRQIQKVPSQTSAFSEQETLVRIHNKEMVKVFGNEGVL